MEDVWIVAVIAIFLFVLIITFRSFLVVLQNNKKIQFLLNEEFIDACIKNNLKRVQELLTHETSADIHYKNDKGLIEACALGHLELVKYLLLSSEIKKHANIHALNDQPFISACQEDRVEIIKYLLTSKKIKSHAYINAQNGEGFFTACDRGNFQTVKYLTSHPELNIDISNYPQYKRNSFIAACSSGSVETVNHLALNLNILLSREVIEAGFFAACDAGNFSLIEWFIFEYNFSVDTQIKKQLEQKFNNFNELYLLKTKIVSELEIYLKISQIVERKEFFNKLNNELAINEVNENILRKI